jgi:hypothetical protein
MTATKQYKMVLWAIAVLVALNIGLLSVIWYQRMDRFRQVPRPGERPSSGDILARELGFDEQQASQLHSLQNEHFHRADSIEHIIRDLSRQLMEETFANSPATTRIRQLSDEIGRARAAFERQVSLHFRQLRELCDTEQVKTLRRVVLQAMERPGAPGTQRQPPGANPPHPPPR